MTLTSSTPEPVHIDQSSGGEIWRNKTLIDAFGHSLSRFPDKTLVVAGEKRWTYREVADKVEKLAQNLVILGIEAGDVISVQLPNWAEFVIIHLAATKVGAITNPLLPIYRAKEIGYILNFARTKMVFIADSFRKFSYTELYAGLTHELPDLRHICVVGPTCPDEMIPFAKLLEPINSPIAIAVAPDGDDVNVLIFTSGTEATPKGVAHTHNSLMYGNMCGKDLLQLTEDEVIWAVSPIGHATGLEWTLRMAIILGGTMVLQDVWEVNAALDLIEREKCTFTTGATTFAAALLEGDRLADRDLSSFRTFLCGGAAIPASLGQEMQVVLGCTLVPCWGMSECFAGTMCSVNDPPERRWGSDGRALPGSETVIFSEGRAEILPSGTVGEIATRGPHVSPGYLNDPVRTADTFSPDGWLFSNDLGTLDDEGYLKVIGRIKDIINRGGLKISAGEVEDLAIKHPAIRAIAIVGVPDKVLGERSCACVIPVSGAAVTLESLTSFLKDAGMSSYKLPEFLAIVDVLPMTPTGKVQKFMLRDDLASGRIACLSA